MRLNSLMSVNHLENLGWKVLKMCLALICIISKDGLPEDGSKSLYFCVVNRISLIKGSK